MVDVLVSALALGGLVVMTVFAAAKAPALARAMALTTSAATSRGMAMIRRLMRTSSEVDTA